MDFGFEQLSSLFLNLPILQFPGVPLRSFACYDSHNCISNCTVVLLDTEMALDLSAVDDILNVKVIKFNISVLSNCV